MIGGILCSSFFIAINLYWRDEGKLLQTTNILRAYGGCLGIKRR